MMVHLEPRHFEEIVRILKDHSLLRHAFVFGSRARGDHRPLSDLDLLIKSDQPVPLGTIAKLEIAFSSSDLPFKVDIVDWAMLSDEFRVKITPELSALAQ